jgi:OOP family OmpA-OmpF porin
VVCFKTEIASIDGDPRGFVFASKAPADATVEFVYRLPAQTTFERLAVPNVLETPSPAQTFTRKVDVLGSSVGPDGPFELLGSATLTTHAAKGQFTELNMTEPRAVDWIMLRLGGGIEVRQDEMFYEFTEIIGNGEQAPMRLSDTFSGAWKGRGVKLTLTQDGAVVVGCYDRNGELAGTIDGSILRARGVSPDDGIESLFVLQMHDGAITGVRSTNGAPFHRYVGTPTDDSGTRCAKPVAPTLGCGAVVHAIRFDYDSANIRPESAAVLDALADGLKSASARRVRIEGHTSSEGDDAYNQGLSERRAQAVIDALLARGLPEGSLIGAGRGEAVPIATNDDETGRSLNRRVEVVCLDG